MHRCGPACVSRRRLGPNRRRRRGRGLGLGRGLRPAPGLPAALRRDAHHLFNAGDAVDRLAEGGLLDGRGALLAELRPQAVPVPGLDHGPLLVTDLVDLEGPLLADVAHALADWAGLGLVLVLDDDLPALLE